MNIVNRTEGNKATSNQTDYVDEVEEKHEGVGKLDKLDDDIQYGIYVSSYQHRELIDRNKQGDLNDKDHNLGTNVSQYIESYSIKEHN